MDNFSKNIQRMFDNISGHYDFLNRFLSFRRDIYWRKKAAGLLNINPHSRVLDIACGTGDMINSITNIQKDISPVGIDFSTRMLKIAKIKNEKSVFVAGDAQHLPLKKNTFDIITIAFGFRNFSNKRKSLREINNILSKDGKLCILEFSKPDGLFFSALYKLYFIKILPSIGGMISKEREAYKYLPDSVYNFPDREDYRKMILSAGFRKVIFNPLTFGICDATICIK